MVDGFPELETAIDDRINVLLCWLSSSQSVCADHMRKETNLVDFVESAETTSLGKLALNAPRQLIVLGTCCVIIGFILSNPE